MFLCLFTVFVGTDEAEPAAGDEIAVEAERVARRDFCWAIEKADTRGSCATRGTEWESRRDVREAVVARDEEAGIRITMDVCVCVSVYPETGTR